MTPVLLSRLQRASKDYCCRLHIVSFLYSADFPASVALGILSSDSQGTVYFNQAQLSEVPLPAAAWLFGSALLGLGAIKRKKA